MLKRRHISSKTGMDDGMFLSDVWDQALVGYVEQGSYNGNTTIRPCYGYQALKVVAKTMHSRVEDVYRDMLSCSSADGPVVLHKLTRRALWDKISEIGLPRWVSLDRSVLGIGFHRCACAGIVYNKAISIDILMKTQAASEDNGMAGEFAQAVRFLEGSIIPVGLGDCSPWFLTIINN